MEELTVNTLTLVRITDRGKAVLLDLPRKQRSTRKIIFRQDQRTLPHEEQDEQRRLSDSAALSRRQTMKRSGKSAPGWRAGIG